MIVVCTNIIKGTSGIEIGKTYIVKEDIPANYYDDRLFYLKDIGLYSASQFSEVAYIREIKLNEILNEI